MQSTGVSLLIALLVFVIVMAAKPFIVVLLLRVFPPKGASGYGMVSGTWCVYVALPVAIAAFVGSLLVLRRFVYTK